MKRRNSTEHAAHLMQQSPLAPVPSFKRSRTGEVVPSPVLHVRALPQHTTEADLIALVAPFATTPVRTLILSQSAQSFIQLPDIDTATRLLTHYNTHPASAVVRGKQVYLQYSNRQEISSSSSGHSHSNSNSHVNVNGHSNNNSADMSNSTFHFTPNATQPNAFSLPHAHHRPSLSLSSVSSTHSNGNSNINSNIPPNSILLVTVHNTRALPTLEQLTTVFSPYGTLQKIVLFNKNGSFKALVQYDSLEHAVIAKHSLDGKELFAQCCQLQIGFSKLQEITVKQNSATQRDFTTFNAATNPNSFPHSNNTPLLPFTPSAATFSSSSAPLLHTSNALLPSHMQLTPSHHHNNSMSSTAIPLASTPVVLVNNIPETFTCDMLFTLFSLYGNVLRVKILYNKRDTALIQYQHAQSAYLATVHLNNLSLYGKQLHVSSSKHHELSLSRDNSNPAADSQLAHDYSNSSLHRFKSYGGLIQNPKAIHPPAAVLHVTSIADTVSEDQLRALFTVEGCTPVVHFFRVQPSSAQRTSLQAFVKFDSVETAVLQLVRLHNHPFHGRYLKLAFSSRVASEVHDTDIGHSTSSLNNNSSHNNSNGGSNAVEQSGHEEDALHLLPNGF